MTKRVLQLNFDLWLQSMCRVSYAAEFGRYRMAQCCPPPLVNTRTTTGFNNKRSDGVWRSASLAHLWSRWNAAYANETRRYGHLRGEDLEAIRRDIDPRLLDAFRYAFSDARRREVVGGDAACSASSPSRWRRGG